MQICFFFLYVFLRYTYDESSNDTVFNEVLIEADAIPISSHNHREQWFYWDRMTSFSLSLSLFLVLVQLLSFYRSVSF